MVLFGLQLLPETLIFFFSNLGESFHFFYFDSCLVGFFLLLDVVSRFHGQDQGIDGPHEFCQYFCFVGSLGLLVVPVDHFIEIPLHVFLLAVVSVAVQLSFHLLG